MYYKLIKNDFKSNPLITMTIAMFILAAALLTSLASILFVNLSGGINAMMVEARTPHFMQMHSGDIDLNRLADFTRRQDNVEDFQVLDFLNIDGGDILINQDSLDWSLQDNGFSKQSTQFDFLLDLDNNIITPKDGEIYVPIYYMKDAKVTIGDIVSVGDTEFRVTGFLRDSQMNSSIASSKRFLISQNDFQSLHNYGSLEYLIEYRLIDSANISAFEKAYMTEGLEANGPPAITYQLFKLANGITDGIMIAVLVFISILVIIIAFLCIRFTLLAKIEEDYRGIGVLKAIGMRVSNIKMIYLVKYGAIALFACSLGFMLSLVIKEPFLENIYLYMGKSDYALLSFLSGIGGSVLIFLVLIMYVNRILKGFRKISAAEAMRFTTPQEKVKWIKGFQLSRNKVFSLNSFLGIHDLLSRKKLYLTMLLVNIISIFITLVPYNIYNTLSSEKFITYMGVGISDIRLDIQQTDNIAEKSQKIAEMMAQDNNITKFTVLTNYMFSMKMDDGSSQRLKVELGDHSIFPIEYNSGRAPNKQTEIAISSMNATDLTKSVGDDIFLLVDGKEVTFSVVGIYSDITNGGKTAKGLFPTTTQDVLWVTIPVKLTNDALINLEIAKYKEKFPYAKVSNVEEYLKQTLGSTISSLKKISSVSIAITGILSILITLLLMKMVVVKDRYAIAVLKTLGFTNSAIYRQYLVRATIILILSIIMGTVLSNTLGELVGVTLISSFGVSKFNFIVNPYFTYLFSPLLIIFCIYLATWFGISDIDKLKVSQYIKE